MNDDSRAMSEECRRAREEIARYLDGDLDHAARERIEGHLAACPECGAFLASMKKTDELTASAASEGTHTEESDAAALLASLHARFDMKEAARLRAKEGAAARAWTPEQVAAAALEPSLRRGTQTQEKWRRTERVADRLRRPVPWHWFGIATAAAAAVLVTVLLVARDTNLPKTALERGLGYKRVDELAATEKKAASKPAGSGAPVAVPAQRSEGMAAKEAVGREQDASTRLEQERGRSEELGQPQELGQREGPGRPEEPGQPAQTAAGSEPAKKDMPLLGNAEVKGELAPQEAPDGAVANMKAENEAVPRVGEEPATNAPEPAPDTWGARPFESAKSTSGTTAEHLRADEAQESATPEERPSVAANELQQMPAGEAAARSARRYSGRRAGEAQAPGSSPSVMPMSLSDAAAAPSEDLRTRLTNLLVDLEGPDALRATDSRRRSQGEPAERQRETAKDKSAPLWSTQLRSGGAPASHAVETERSAEGKGLLSLVLKAEQALKSGQYAPTDFSHAAAWLAVADGWYELWDAPPTGGDRVSDDMRMDFADRAARAYDHAMMADEPADFESGATDEEMNAGAEEEMEDAGGAPADTTLAETTQESAADEEAAESQPPIHLNDEDRVRIRERLSELRRVLGSE